MEGLSIPNGNSGPELKMEASGEATATTGSVDKIRDILFGSQMRDYETRFGRLEEALLVQTAELREITKKRMDSLEGYFKKELEALQSRLKTEREERSDAVKQLSRETKDLDDAVYRKIREIENHGSDAERCLREQLLEQSKELLEQIQRRHTELAALLESRIQELSSKKTDRAALAALFTEFGMRLNKEFHIAGAEA